jgi:4-amino-4-deoxy-L-arabinose transferase-like glycosyltransferase
LLAILILAAILRFHGLGQPSFDGDELYAVRIQGLTPDSIGAIFGRSAFHDLHPPLSYYSFLLWESLFGTAEPIVRTLPVLWGLLAVTLIGVVGRRLGGSLAGLAAALLLAFNPLHIAYCQEARPYAQAIALSLAAHLFLLRSLTGGRRRDRLLYAVFCALAIYSHYFALLALAPHALALLYLLLTGDTESRRAARQTLLALVCGFATFLGWIPALAHQMTGQPEGPTLDVYELGDSPAANLVITAGYLRDVAGLGRARPLLPAVLSATILLGLAFTWRARRIRLAPDPDLPDGEDEAPILSRQAGVALVLGALALGAALALLAPVHLLPKARLTLLEMGYSPATIERELRSFLLFALSFPAAMATIGGVVLAWRPLTALLGRLPRRFIRGPGRPLGVPVLLAVLFVIPLAATAVLAAGGARFLTDRNLLLFLPPLCLALGLGVGRLLARRPEDSPTAAWSLPGGRWATLPLLFALGLAVFDYAPVSGFFGVPGQRLGMTTGNWRALAAKLGRTSAADAGAEPFVMAKHSRTDPGLFYLRDYNPRRVRSQDAPLFLAAAGGPFLYLHVVGNRESEALLASLEKTQTLRPTLRVDEYVLYEVDPPGESAAGSAGILPANLVRSN